MDENSEVNVKPDSRPSPEDFDLYLPWACNQLQLEYTVEVTRVYQNEYVSSTVTERSKKAKSRTKLVHSPIDETTKLEKEEKSAYGMGLNQRYEKHAANNKVIKITAIYNSHENLVQIKFINNTQLPRVMIKVIGLIIKFQSHLKTITMNSGLDQYTVYEMCKFLPTIQITELCLDDCSLKKPNYHLLLENANFLKYLSLCRCKIDDTVVQCMCSKLIFPLPASNTLSVLNLSSNRITDEGAKFLAAVLRTNRQISYLNLASNMITDEGAIAIFNVLIEFPLTAEEILVSKTRYMTYLLNKNALFSSAMRELRQEDVDRKSAKRKSLRVTPNANSKKTKPETSSKTLFDTVRGLTDVDNALVDKAMEMVNNALGDFVDPFSVINTFVRDNIKYCVGNNTLCCLNISYNYLSYLTLGKIQKVLLYQKLVGRIPRGLLSVSVEGNYVPIACKELSQIDNILQINLMTQTRKLSAFKKRLHPKAIH